MDLSVHAPRAVSIIDAWAQPWTDEVVQALDERTAHVFRRYASGEGTAKGIALEAMVAEMDRSPVDVTLLSGAPTVPMGLVLECLERWPDRLLGVACVDPRQGIMRAVRQLERLVRDYPICALKLEPYYFERPPTDRIFYPLFSKCEELGITLQTQVGGTGPLYPSRPGQPLHIDELALDFPDLRVVCGHVGSPWVAEMLHVAWKHDNVFIDTSARRPRHFETEFRTFLKTYGQDKCIYASDWPLLSFSGPLGELDDLNLTSEVRNKFLCHNAIRAFQLEKFGIVAQPS